jgi:AraC-like DNA-binding protein
MTGTSDAWFRPRGLVHRRVSSRVAHVRRRLQQAVQSGDSFETERWALAALHAVADDSGHARVRGPYRRRDNELDAVIAVCRDIEKRPAPRLSVADRARSVQMTSTRLTRAFARYLGMSPHQYVVRWRLATACALLDEGTLVSETCYRVGFENLSHFCRSFQRALGCRPSRWSTFPLRERRRKVQAMLGWRS